MRHKDQQKNSEAFHAASPNLLDSMKIKIFVLRN